MAVRLRLPLIPAYLTLAAACGNTGDASTGDASSTSTTGHATSDTTGTLTTDSPTTDTPTTDEGTGTGDLSSGSGETSTGEPGSTGPVIPDTSTGTSTGDDTGTGAGTTTDGDTSTGAGTTTDGDTSTGADTSTTGGQCGDGTLDDGEDCDDANLDDGDGCSATCEVEADGGCAPGTINILQNADFETGALPPWITDAPNTTKIVDFAHTGMWAAQTIGGDNIEQSFAAVPVKSLTTASFWSWHDLTDNPILYAEWGYADNTTSGLLFIGDQLDGWQQHELLGNLSKNKSLVFLRIYGYSGGGPAADISRYDDFSLCSKP